MGHKTGLLTLSDDSGLEIDALNGRPGVRSARYAKTDAERIQKVLDEMHEVPDQNRGAQFRCVMAVYDPVYTRVYTFSGTCKGRILHQKKGDKSFGYSPIFYFDAYGKTYGEMEIEERSSISHRGQALKKAAQYLTKSL
jgi:XTP/dITP diphosphohydrolase